MALTPIQLNNKRLSLIEDIVRYRRFINDCKAKERELKELKKVTKNRKHMYQRKMAQTIETLDLLAKEYD